MEPLIYIYGRNPLFEGGKVYTFSDGLEAQFFFADNISDLKEKKRKN